MPKALDLKNLVDALPTVVERTALKPGWVVSWVAEGIAFSLACTAVWEDNMQKCLCAIKLGSRMLARRLGSLGWLGMDLDEPRVRPQISAATPGAPWLGSKTGAFLRFAPVLPGSRGAGDSGLLLDHSTRSSSYSGTAACSQQLHGQSGDGDAGHSRWDQNRDRRVRRQEYAERRKQVRMDTVPQSACRGGQKRKLEQLYFE